MRGIGARPEWRRGPDGPLWKPSRLMAARDMMETPIRFGSDQGALRSEDVPLVTGHGQFTDDLNVRDQVYAAFVRAQFGHATISNVDVAQARSMPGVIGIFTG